MTWYQTFRYDTFFLSIQYFWTYDFLHFLQKCSENKNLIVKKIKFFHSLVIIISFTARTHLNMPVQWCHRSVFHLRGYIIFSMRVILKTLLPVLMWNEKCSFDVTSIRILSLSVEYFLVVFVIIQIYGTIECEQDNLRRLEIKKNYKRKLNQQNQHSYKMHSCSYSNWIL